jgi:GTPase SAR1 family protein
VTNLTLTGAYRGGVPTWPANLERLTQLNLYGNQLAEIPKWLRRLVALKVLNLSGNWLTAVPSWISELGQLEVLNLSKNEIAVLPESIFQLERLKRFDIGNNRQTRLFDGIGTLTKLTDLDVSYNQLEEVPNTLAHLNRLERLRLGGNKLINGPEALAALTSLTYLDISSNKLSIIPESYGNLVALRMLDLSDNRLTSLPDSLKKLTNLFKLYLNSNQLDSVPPWIGDLHLASLDIRDNQITDLPTSLSNLPMGADLQIEKNPLPEEIIAAARNRGLHAFLKSMAEAAVDITEAKLILVGEGEAGKTTLLAALRGEDFEENRSTTHGLEIKTITLEHEHGSITLRGWDFGGQREYRPTHQLFFSSGAIYLLVWKPRTGPQLGMVDYWIDLIRHRAGPGVKIILVATHADSDTAFSDLDETRLQQEYPGSIVGFYSVDSRTGSGIEVLRSAIADAASALPSMRRRVPRAWHVLRNWIASLPDTHISLDLVQHMSASHGLDARFSEAMLPVGHTLGLWVYYGDQPDLSDLVILKGDWLSTAIALILEDEPTRAAWGLLSHERLKDIWSNPRRPSELQYPRSLYHSFLRLMELFDISYRAPEKENQSSVSLIPQLLPSARPELAGVWADAAEGPECTAYCQPIDIQTNKPAAPEGLMPRLIVRNHWNSLGSADIRKAMHWRSGVVLQNRYGARALVEMQGTGISICTRGNDAGGYLVQLLEGVRDLVCDFWPGLETQILLPCPNPSCRLARQFDLDKLHQRLKMGKTTAECQSCYTSIEIYRIINQVPYLGNTINNEELDSLIRALTSQVASVDHKVDELTDATKALASRAETSVRALLRALDDEGIEGPRTFLVEELDRNFLSPKITHVRLKVTLYCEHSLLPVHHFDGAGAGIITVDVPKDWWRKARPVIRVASTLVGLLTPISAAALQLNLDDASWANVGESVNLGKELTQGLATGGKDLGTAQESVVIDTFSFKPKAAEGASLRQLHALLKERDPGFGDLRKVRAPDAKVRWVHRNFLSLYMD